MKSLAATCFLAALSGYSWAWSDAGHMVVAAVAEKQLKPAVRTEALRLIALDSTDRTNTFLTAACWADDARSGSDEAWHYINYFFDKDFKPVALRPKRENIVRAISEQRKILATSVDDRQRSRALKYLLHFMGDIHQPLHTMAQVSEAYPDGDRGGNDFGIVSPPNLPNVQNLHALWDAACGAFPRIPRPVSLRNEQAIRRYADQALATLSFIPKMVSPEAMARESYDLRRNVYGTPFNEQPSEAYLASGRQLSRERIAIAGSRLAMLLNATLKPR